MYCRSIGQSVETKKKRRGGFLLQVLTPGVGLKSAGKAKKAIVDFRKTEVAISQPPATSLVSSSWVV